MKEGDRLVCIFSTGFNNFTMGKLYTIYKIEDVYDYVFKHRLFIRGNDGSRYRFSLEEDENGKSYKNWFVTEREYRKMKLDKINGSRL